MEVGRPYSITASVRKPEASYYRTTKEKHVLRLFDRSSNAGMEEILLLLRTIRSETKENKVRHGKARNGKKIWGF